MIRSARWLLRGTTSPVGAKLSPMGAIASLVEAIRSVPARPVCKTVIEGDDFASGGEDFANGGDSFANGGDSFPSCSTEIRCLTIRSARWL
ncbi:hypothetical protein R1flu_000498 [Riccia fluitans]|uniref:Uncharacterized protein n=1 Tax=Riccia fluitans TaxID=41844 RepID=A0ABD1Y0L3_9MARC